MSDFWKPTAELYEQLFEKPKMSAEEKNEDVELDEVLKKSDSTDKWISDFVHSKDPKFAGKSKKERIQMALGAKYAKMREDVDYEGEMAKYELRNLIQNAQELMSSLDDDTQLEAWVQSKITKANDYLNSVTQYLGYQNTKQGPTDEKLEYTLDNGK
jgi:hypothetical protein